MQDQASPAPQSTGWCCSEKGLSQGSRVLGSGHRSSLLLPPALGAPSMARRTDASMLQRCFSPDPGSSGFSQPCFPASVLCWVPDASSHWWTGFSLGHGCLWPVWHVCPASCLQHQGGRIPPPPATKCEERLPVVTNPAESGRRLRCSQSPREIVPRASPQLPGMGTRASLLGPPQPPGVRPALQGLWECIGAPLGATKEREAVAGRAQSRADARGCPLSAL